MKRTPNNEYLRTKVLTASPAELRLMLLDGAIRFTEQARDGLATRNFERMFEGVSRAQAILLELLNGLDPRHDAELCKRLSGLYTYMYTRLVAANSIRDMTILDEVVKLLGFEHETWLLLMDKLADEQGAAPAGPDATQAFDSTQDARDRAGAATGSRLSVQG